jgi:hypothetical protein
MTLAICALAPGAKSDAVSDAKNIAQKISAVRVSPVVFAVRLILVPWKPNNNLETGYSIDSNIASPRPGSMFLQY